MNKSPNPTYEVKCPKCGAEPGHRCTQRGFEQWRAHRQRVFAAERVNGGLMAAFVQQEAADRTAVPRRVTCPQCGALPGELCMRISQPADNVRGWDYCAPEPTRCKPQYCQARWMVAKGEADYDADESATETGLWAGAAESATDNELLAEAPDDTAPGEPTATTRQRIEEIVAERKLQQAEQERRRKVLNWGAAGSQA